MRGRGEAKRRFAFFLPFFFFSFSFGQRVRAPARAREKSRDGKVEIEVLNFVSTVMYKSRGIDWNRKWTEKFLFSITAVLSPPFFLCSFVPLFSRRAKGVVKKRRNWRTEFKDSETGEF